MEAKCAFCNKVFESRRDDHIFCSERCNAAHRRHRKKLCVDLPEERQCVFNQGVLCEDNKCENCGWNPAVEKRRKEALT